MPRAAQAETAEIINVRPAVKLLPHQLVRVDSTGRGLCTHKTLTHATRAEILAPGWFDGVAELQVQVDDEIVVSYGPEAFDYELEDRLRGTMSGYRGGARPHPQLRVLVVARWAEPDEGNSKLVWRCRVVLLSERPAPVVDGHDGLDEANDQPIPI